MTYLFSNLTKMRRDLAVNDNLAPNSRIQFIKMNKT